MKTASITEAKNQLSKLIELVKKGESVTIYDRDKPVARLVPVQLGSDDDEEAHLADLERRGLIRRPLEPWDPKLLDFEPIKLPDGYSAVEELIKERRNGR